MPRSSISPDSRSARSLRKRYSLPAPSDSRLFLQTIRYGLAVPQGARPYDFGVVRVNAAGSSTPTRVGGASPSCLPAARTHWPSRSGCWGTSGTSGFCDSPCWGRGDYNDWLALGGISNSVLSSRLAVLTAGGMLERREYQQNPPRHEYSVTRKGQSIWPVLITMWSWEKQWAPNETQPLPPLRHSTCGNDFTPILRCKECGEGRGRTIPGLPNGVRVGTSHAVSRKQHRDDAPPSPNAVRKFWLTRWNLSAIAGQRRSSVQLSEALAATESSPRSPVHHRR